MRFFILVILIMLSEVACDDIMRNCQNDAYPMWCESSKECCPTAFPYSCGGHCYLNATDAWNSCGQYGITTELCKAE